MPVKILHLPEVRDALGAFDNYGSPPLFFELASRIMQYRLAVTEACHLKIASGQLLQTTFAFFEVFVPQTQSQAHQVAARISGKEHASVLRPQKRKLPRAVAWGMDRGQATGNLQLLSVFHVMFNRSGFNRPHGSYEQSKENAAHHAWRSLQRTKTA